MRFSHGTIILIIARCILYTSLILPLLDYADIIWGDKNNSVLMNSLQIQENKAAKLIVDAPPLSSATEALKLLNWTPLGIRRHKLRCIFIFKCINGLIDFDFKLTANNSIHSYNTNFGLSTSFFIYNLTSVSIT